MTITREEAIKTLKELWRGTNDQWYEETYAMAIDALSEQNCMTCKYYYEVKNKYGIKRCCLQDEARRMEKRAGKWEYCEHEIADHVDGYKCSHCGFFIPWDYMHKSIYFIEDYNFCPSCGVNLKGENK